MRVYVVYWNGDEDCGGRNDGPVAVTTDEAEARAIMAREAEAEAAERLTDVSEWKSGLGLSLGGERCEVRVAEFDLATEGGR